MVKTMVQTRLHIPTLLLLAWLLAACQPVSLVSVATGSAVTATTMMAAANPEQCTLATLKGRYLFAHSGTILPPTFGVKEPTPGADAGFHIYNGDGTGTDIVTVRVDSKIFLENITVPISYTVNANCTGIHKVLIDNGPSFDLFIAPKGDTIAVIATAPSGNYPSGIDTRVSSK